MVNDLPVGCADPESQLDCYVRALIDSSPTITSAVSDSETITVTGTGFTDASLDGWTPTVCIQGVDCSLNTDITDTEMGFLCPGGVPRSVNNHDFDLKFTSPSQSDLFKRPYKASDVQIVANPPVVTSSSSDLVVSFSGGNSYEIQADGLYSTLLNADCEATSTSDNKVTVCGKVCEFDTSQQSATSAFCKLPKIATRYSSTQFANFNIAADLIRLASSVSASTPSELSKWYDYSLTETIADSNSPCWFETEYPSGEVGIVKTARFFAGSISNINHYVNAFKLQGSNDGGSTWTDLWTADSSIREGWNSFTWEDDLRPVYNKYRWRGNDANACKVQEVEMIGVVAIDDENSQITCDVELVVDG